jgi:hypothetical protein
LENREALRIPCSIAEIRTVGLPYRKHRIASLSNESLPYERRMCLSSLLHLEIRGWVNKEEAALVFTTCPVITFQLNSTS